MNLRIIATLIGVIVYPLIFLWLHHMEQQNAALDARITRWIHSLPFILLVFIGSISGGITISSFFTKKSLKIAVGLLASFIVPIIFFHSYEHGYIFSNFVGLLTITVI